MTVILDLRTPSTTSLVGMISRSSTLVSLMVQIIANDSPAQEKVASCPRVTLVDCGGTSVQLKGKKGKQCEVQVYICHLLLKSILYTVLLCDAHIHCMYSNIVYTHLSTSIQDVYYLL